MVDPASGFLLKYLQGWEQKRNMFKFLKRLFISAFCVTVLCAAVVSHPANAAISSVEHIHKQIRQQKGAIVSLAPTSDISHISSARYLYEKIDQANKILNGVAISDYATEYSSATTPVDAERALQDIKDLIRLVDGFEITLQSVDSFSFKISAAGNFVIDWGDGKIDYIQKTDTGEGTFSHSYESSGNYVVKLGGQATEYNRWVWEGVISFENSVNKEKMVGIAGSLGQIFPTLPDGSNPKFPSTFKYCTGLKAIPANLFSGITGQPTDRMFSSIFFGCSGLTEPIPAGLFSGLSGTYTSEMFFLTFYLCSNLTGEISADFFGNLHGAPAHQMFRETFGHCNNLSGPIPAGLFGNMTGSAAESMFYRTFHDCKNLTGSIPSGLFGNLTGNTAQQCSMARSWDAKIWTELSQVDYLVT